MPGCPRDRGPRTVVAINLEGYAAQREAAGTQEAERSERLELEARCRSEVTHLEERQAWQLSQIANRHESELKELTSEQAVLYQRVDDLGPRRRGHCAALAWR
jgi:hypothetical protein